MTDRWRWIRWGSLAVAAGLMLHVAITSQHDTQQHRRFVLNLLAWNLVPLVPPLAWPLSRRPALATAWALGCAAAHAYAYWAVVVHPTSSTSALLYLFLPVYVLVGVGPLSLGCALAVRRLGRATRRPVELEPNERPSSPDR